MIDVRHVESKVHGLLKGNQAMEERQGIRPTGDRYYKSNTPQTGLLNGVCYARLKRSHYCSSGEYDSSEATGAV